MRSGNGHDNDGGEKRPSFDTDSFHAGGVAATDSRHYSKISDDSYRIIPFAIGKRDIPTIHGANERLSLDNLKRGIVLFKVLIERV